VIEARIDETKRHNPDIPGTGEICMALLCCSNSIGNPQTRSINREQSVPFSFKGYFVRQTKDSITRRAKPATKVILFSPTFRMKEAAEKDGSAAL
jgi:hypothetical protein